MPKHAIISSSVDKPDLKPRQGGGVTLLHKPDAEEARIVEEMDEKEVRQEKKGD